MSRYTCARAVFLGAALVALAGCGSAAGASSAASSSSPAGATSSTTGTMSPAQAATPTVSPGSVVAAGSIPFPVAVGDTWVYQVVTSINNAHALDTKKVVDVTPMPDGHQVTMADSASSGAAASTLQHYLFYGNGQIGFPVNEAHGVSVVSSNGVTWPDAAGAASGRPYHSVLNIKLSSGQVKTANVTVRGGGTESVSVPAGTYRATLVNMSIVTTVGSFTSISMLKVWTAPGIGPVKTEQVLKAGGKTQVTTTTTLLSFTKQPTGS